MTNDCGRCTPCNCELPKVKRELLLTDLPNFSLRRAGKCEDPRHSGGVAQFRPNVALAFLLTPGMTRALERFTAEAFASLFNQVKERMLMWQQQALKSCPTYPHTSSIACPSKSIQSIISSCEWDLNTVRKMHRRCKVLQIPSMCL